MPANKDSKEKLVIIDSRNKAAGRKNEKIVLTVKAKDLPEGIKKEDVVAAFRVNAEEEEKKVESKEERTGEKEKKDSKFKPKRWVAIAAIPIVLLGMARGCKGREKIGINSPEPEVPQQTQEQMSEEEMIDIKDIRGVQYDVPSPYVYMEAATNARGQEGMTANVLSGRHAMNGKHYDSSEQFKNEEQASVGHEEFEQMEEQLKRDLEVLTNSDATQEEKCEAARRVLETNQKIEKIYKDNLPFIEEQASKFEDATLAYADEHSKEEIAVIRETINEYKENLGLSSENIASIESILELTEKGYKLQISGEENSRGDYTITGEAVKEVAEEMGISKEAEKNLAELCADKENALAEKGLEGEKNAI